MATDSAATGDDSQMGAPVAAIISLFIPGVGHYLAGLEQRGLYWFLGAAAWYIIMFIGFFLLFGWLMAFVTPLLHLGSAADAFIQLKD